MSGPLSGRVGAALTQHSAASERGKQPRGKELIPSPRMLIGDNIWAEKGLEHQIVCRCRSSAAGCHQEGALNARRPMEARCRPTQRRSSGPTAGAFLFRSDGGSSVTTHYTPLRGVAANLENRQTSGRGSHEDLLSDSRPPASYEDPLSQTEDLLSQTEDLLSQTEDLLSQTEDLLSQTQDLLSQTQDVDLLSPTTPDPQTSRPPDLQTPRPPDLQTPRPPVDPNPRPPDLQTSRPPDPQTSCRPKPQTSRPPDLQTSRPPDPQTSCRPRPQTPRPPDPRPPDLQTPRPPDPRPPDLL
ncbi:unnamed protein product [Gadus morhua 'NCC']